MKRVALPNDEAVERLRSAFVYNPETGIFRYQNDRGRLSGRMAGTSDGQGYLALSLHGYRVKAHRAAWALCNGTMPEGLIDHINGDRLDNRIANLRLVTPKINRENQRRARSDSTTGLMGVTPKGARFKGVVRVEGRRVSCGIFDSPMEAHMAAMSEKRRSHPGFLG